MVVDDRANMVVDEGKNKCEIYEKKTAILIW